MPYDFECKCEYPWYGRYCELKINVCENTTCNRQGICYSNLTEPICKCFTGYTGDNCEIQSLHMMNDAYAILLYVLFILVFMLLILFLERFKNSYMLKKESKPIHF